MTKMENNFKALFLNKKVDRIDSTQMKPIRNGAGFGNKPYGALWFAEYTPEAQFMSDWQRWCYYEQFNLKGVFGEGIVFTFKECARIAVVDSQSDYEAFAEKYPLDESIRFRVNKIDWVKLSHDYDVFFLTENGRYELYDEFYGWDVASGVVFHPIAIATQEHVVVDAEAVVGVEAADYMLDSAKERLYVYSFKLAGKGRQSGFATATSSYEVMEQLWAKYTLPTNSYKENQEIRDSIDNSLEIYLARETGMTLCDHNQELFYF